MTTRLSARLLSSLRSGAHGPSNSSRAGPVHDITGTFATLERFYLDDGARRRLTQMRAMPRLFRRLTWLTKSLLMKLTPARRMMVATGLVLAFGSIPIAGGIVSIEILGAEWDLRQPIAALGAVVVSIVLMLELKDKLLAKKELEAGRAVQLALMPKRSPKIPGWDVWLYTSPANDVGGDFVDHLQIDESRHGVALGDVAGKALPAALLMVKLQATLRALVPQFRALDELGQAVNRILQRDGLPNRFATLLYMELTTASSELRVLNAGHQPPLLLRKQRVEEMPTGSLPLGLLPDVAFFEQRIDLDEQEVLIVVSDGIVEATNAGGEFFGEERLHRAIMQCAGRPAGAVGLQVLGALDEFVREAPMHDDVSIVAVGRRRTRRNP